MRNQCCFWKEAEEATVLAAGQPNWEQLTCSRFWAGLRPSLPLLSVPAGRARSSFTAKNAMLRPAGPWLTFSFSFCLSAYFCFLVTALGVTAGAHRLWSHRSYKAKLPLRIFLAAANSMAFQVGSWLPVPVLGLLAALPPVQGSLQLRDIRSNVCVHISKKMFADGAWC